MRLLLLHFASLLRLRRTAITDFAGVESPASFADAFGLRGQDATDGMAYQEKVRRGW